VTGSGDSENTPRRLSDRELMATQCTLSLTAKPLGILEAVNPVVLGKVRRKTGADYEAPASALKFFCPSCCTAMRPLQ